jgi:hypothetical protein
MRGFDLIEMGFQVGDTVWEMGQKPWKIWNIREPKRLFCIDIECNGEQEVITNLGQYSDEMLPTFFPNRFEIPAEAFEKPRPELAVDTPIWVRDSDSLRWRPMHFALWAAGDYDSFVVFTWRDGATKHSSNGKLKIGWKQYRLTDPKEGE